jgi:hypothetical protein
VEAFDQLGDTLEPAPECALIAALKAMVARRRAEASLT